jgi:hypothetical protein
VQLLALPMLLVLLVLGLIVIKKSFCAQRSISNNQLTLSAKKFWAIIPQLKQYFLKILGLDLKNN